MWPVKFVIRGQIVSTVASIRKLELCVALSYSLSAASPWEFHESFRYRCGIYYVDASRLIHGVCVTENSDWPGHRRCGGRKWGIRIFWHSYEAAVCESHDSRDWAFLTHQASEKLEKRTTRWPMTKLFEKINRYPKSHVFTRISGHRISTVESLVLFVMSKNYGTLRRI